MSHVTKETEKTVGGIRCCYALNPSLHRFCLGLYVRAGSMYEDETENGITHLFEHTVFRNVKKKFPGNFYELLSANGLTFNAVTYREFVNFYVSGSPAGFSLAVKILISVFDGITVSGEEYRAEKKRIKSEIREDDEKSTLSFFSDSHVWAGTPLMRPITGTCATVDRIPIRRLNEFRASILTRDNLFFFLTGCVSDADLTLFENAAAALDLPESREKRRNLAPVPAAFGKRQLSFPVKNETYYRAAICFDVDNAVCPSGVRELICAALFRGEAALVYLMLSEDDPVVYSFDYTLEQYDNISVIKLEYEVSKRDLVRSVRSVIAALDRVKNGEFSFDAVKNGTAALVTAEQDNAEELNWSLAYDGHVLAGQPVDYGSPDLGRFDGITKEDLMRAAKRLFVCRNLTASFKGNRAFIESCGLGEIFSALG